jgi:hypothetical protein
MGVNNQGTQNADFSEGKLRQVFRVAKQELDFKNYGEFASLSAKCYLGKYRF